jgi:uncharacterized caspase-like protein/DNA-binding beta-propeller fold protein YncE
MARAIANPSSGSVMLLVAAWRVLVWLTACLAVGHVLAAEPTTAPQLRLVQAMHNAAVGQIRADRAFTRLFTISADKTLRIWRLADLQRLRMVLLPAEAGLEGTPYALAVSADGKRAFVAGVTGWDWNRAGHIYVVDGERGRIEGTIGRFDKDVVVSMDLSPDGKRLAVGLGSGGLRVVDAESGAVLNSDTAYAGQVGFVHFAGDGRLASSSADGCVRIYERDMKLAFRNQYPPPAPGQPQCTGSELGGIRFSPDGQRLAFGVRYLADGNKFLPEVVVMDARSLTVRRTVRATDADQQSLCCIAWSPDGGTLYVNGNVSGDTPTPIYRIRNADSGALERWNVGQQQITNMLPLPDGQIVFATTAPSIAKVDGNGQILVGADGRPMLAAPGNINFHRTRNQPDAFKLSADGRVVAFDAGETLKLRADLGTENLSALLTANDVANPGLSSARKTGAVKVEASPGLYAYKQPTRVNGQDVALDREESVRSWTVHATRSIAAIGTNWRLRLVDARGKPLPGWEMPPYLPAPAYHTLITADARMAVVALGDGTIRWYAIDTGRELLGLFVHANGSDWVAWRADGFYASSPHGDDYVGWLVNRGDKASPDLFRAVQFERKLYRPDLVRAALRVPAPPPGSIERLAETLRQLAAPRVVIDMIQPGSDPNTLAIRLVVESTGRPIQEIGVYVDGLPVLGANERAVGRGEAQRISRTVTARATSARSSIRVEAETDSSIGIDESAPLQIPPSPGRGQPGKLWAVVAGVSRFDSALTCEAQKNCRVPIPSLPNTSNDASELAATLARQAGRSFSSVSTVVLTEESGEPPTRAALIARLKALEKVSPDDTVLVFFASHGFTPDPASGEYYFVPKDATQADLFTVFSAQPGQQIAEGAVPSLITGTELYTLLKRVPGRRILVLDTCHSGSADGRSNPYALFKRSASAQIAVLSASQGNEVSFEVPQNAAGTAPKHGVFTLALLEALQGQAARSPGQAVTLDDAFNYVVPRVASLLKASPATRRLGTQTPTLTSNAALASSVLTQP